MLRIIRSLSSRTTAAVLGLSGLALATCGSPEDQPVPQETPAPRSEFPAPVLPQPPLNRAALLMAIDAARSAYAAGRPQTDGELAGRRFAIRQAFGCGGPSMGAGETVANRPPGVAGWTWARDQRSIEISLVPADWTGTQELSAGEAAWEAMEGYWLSRPWLREDGCPSIPTGAASQVGPAGGAAAHTSGLAAVFEEGSSRVGRRDGRAFNLILRGDPSPAPPVDGYRMVIEGRLTAFPDGRAIRCRSAHIDQAPVCVAAAEVDRVAFEDADGELLKEWRVG